MKTRILLIALCILAHAAVGCAGRDDQPTQRRPPRPSPAQRDLPPTDPNLSQDAAAAFAALPSLSLREDGTLRTFRIVAARSKAAYIVDEELFAGAARKYGLTVGKTKVVGETQDVAGVLQIDLSDTEIGANRFSVYLPTLRTDQNLRDGWIRKNALESDRFPLAILIARQIQNAPENYRQGETAAFQLVGELTLRGAALPTVWDVTASLQGSTLQGRMETRLRMTDLGFDPPNFANTLTVQDEFTVRIDFVAQER